MKMEIKKTCELMLEPPAKKWVSVEDEKRFLQFILSKIYSQFESMATLRLLHLPENELAEKYWDVNYKSNLVLMQQKIEERIKELEESEKGDVVKDEI